MEIIPDVNVFVGNITYIDFTIYDMWLQNMEAEDARDNLINSYDNDCDYPEDEWRFMLYTYVLDQYRIFGMLEPMLQNPTMLSNQICHQICSESQKKLIARYYRFDENVVREFLGKKLSKSTRRDLDEIATKTKVKLKCCQKQFDNCRRVFKSIEDMPGRLVDNIQKQFLLPLDMAWNYSAIVFLSNQRLECSKRKLSSLTLNDFVECSKCLINSWASRSTDSTSPVVDVEFDQEFLLELRSVKILISEQKLYEKHKILTLQKINTKLQNMGNEWSDSSFRPISRAIVGIASTLYKTKDMRNYFVDLYEKVVEPCKCFGWDKSTFKIFLEKYADSVEDLPQMQNLFNTWSRFMKTTTACLLQISHSSVS